MLPSYKKMYTVIKSKRNLYKRTLFDVLFDTEAINLDDEEETLTVGTDTFLAQWEATRE